MPDFLRYLSRVPECADSILPDTMPILPTIEWCHDFVQTFGGFERRDSIEVVFSDLECLSTVVPSSQVIDSTADLYKAFGHDFATKALCDFEERDSVVVGLIVAV